MRATAAFRKLNAQSGKIPVPAEIIVSSEENPSGLWKGPPLFQSPYLATTPMLGAVWKAPSRTPSEQSGLSASPYTPEHKRSASHLGFETPMSFAFSPTFNKDENSSGSSDKTSMRQISASPSPAPYEPKHPNHLAIPCKNVIDLDRIARGLDTRTTVCANR